MGKLRNSILGAAAGAALFLSTEALAEQKQAPEDKPVPPVPADVLEQGGDAVLQWMFENNCVSLEYLRRFTEEKARAASGGQESAESGGESPLLAKFKVDFESLPVEAFKNGKSRPKWKQVAAKLTPKVLAKAANLEMPRIYGVNGNGELLIGDGGSEVPSFTLGKNYFQARNDTRTQGLSLWTRGEYEGFNDGSMEVNTATWLESDDAPTLALFGVWYGYLSMTEYDPKYSIAVLGARRVLRVKL